MKDKKLSEYIQQVGGRELARRLGVDPAAVSQWNTGKRRVGPEMCKKLEEVSGGYLKRAELRPDIFA